MFVQWSMLHTIVFVYIGVMHLELIGCYIHALYLMLTCKIVFLNGLSKLGSHKTIKYYFILAWMIWFYDDVPRTNMLLHVGYEYAYG